MQQGKGPDDVGLDERAGAVDRAVDVRLGGEVHHRVGLVLLENAADLVGVANIDVLEVIAGAVAGLGERFEVAGVGQLVDVDDLVVGFADQLPDHGGPDETGASCQQNLHERSTLRWRNWATLRPIPHAPCALGRDPSRTVAQFTERDADSSRPRRWLFLKRHNPMSKTQLTSSFAPNPVAG